ncbi:MAG: S8 family serine peptidase [Bdellovibrionota bacterium]
MNKFGITGFYAILGFLLVTSGCTKTTVEFAKMTPLSTSRDEIFATRPQNRTHFIALIKLKNPALLTTAKKENGVQKVDSDLATLIDQEQLAFIEDLKLISPDIKVLYRYRLVVNGVTIVAPIKYFESIRQSPKVVLAEQTGRFARPLAPAEGGGDPFNVKEFNSVKFIGAQNLHAQGVRGQGMKVAIIDTGVDFTHAMFSGLGTVEAYKAVNPSLPTDQFPSKKVVGGTDFVGTDFDSASDIFEKRIPLPDVNPMDEGGHGTHVAGTVAGIGDNVKTYDGVAPDALIYALKVFGKDGSTSDEVVIAALEYAADPSGDLDLADQLDVVNMSLGSSYGTPHILYAEAIRNLSLAGTAVVASAGNSGPNPFIVGAPSVAEEAFSVAASIDNGEHNWKFSAVKFLLPEGKEVLTEAVESTISTPISEVGELEGSLVYVGLAAQDFEPEIASQLRGKIALVDRGQVTFAEKMQRSEKAGAIGVIVVNNQDGAAFSMGGDGKVKIPAIMISKALGAEIKAILKEDKEVRLQFKTEEKIEKPELIDNLTDFSSQGPRSVDGLLKPEISAPGQNVISAEMGGGDKPTKMSGTSMAAPHMAGVMALLRQVHPELTVRELKSISMGTALSIKDDKKVQYPISRQGAGRIQVDIAAKAPMVTHPQGVSLGQVDIVGRKKMQMPLEVRAIDGQEHALKVVFVGNEALTVTEKSIKVAADKTVVNFDFIFDGSKVKDQFQEVSGYLKFMEGDKEVFQVPVLAMARQVASVKAKKLVIESSSELDSAKAAAHLDLVNESPKDGLALLFNLLGLDEHKSDPLVELTYSRECDLEAAGYRIVGDKIQFLFKIYTGVTTWNTCEVDVQFDSNNDGLADQELVGVPMERLDGLTGTEFKSLLLDAGKAREIRKEYEALITKEGDIDAEGKKRKVNYADAVISASNMVTYNSSTIAIIEASLADIKLNNQRVVGMKVSTTNIEDYAVEADDYLGKHDKEWEKLDLGAEAQGYMDLPGEVKLAGNSVQTVDLKKGTGSHKLMLLTPYNRGSLSLLEKDLQLSFPEPTYVAP